VLDAAQGLVEKCLLVIVHYDDMTRIRPLEMVREYAAEQLVLRDDVDAVIQSAAEWYAGCIEQFQGDPSKSESAEWFDWFDREVNNIRALVDWSLRSNRVDLALRIVASLGLTWRLHGPLRDGHAIVTAVLSHPDIAQHPFLHARALIAAGHVNEEMGNNALARSYVAESVRMLRGLNAPGWLANALAILADHETALGNFEQAQVYLDESVPLARTSAYHHGTIAALLYQAFLLGMKGDPRGALHFIEDLAAQAEVLNSNFAACLASTFSSGIYWEFGDLHRARALAEEAVERAIELKLGASANISRNILGMILMDMGDRAGAAQLFIEAVDGTSAHGNPDVRADGLVLLAMLRHGDGDSATALVDLRSALRTYRAGGRHAGMPEVVHRIGWVLIDTGKTELGATLCGAANAWSEAVGINLPSRDQAAHTAHMAAASAALGAVSFERAFQTGRAMDRDAVVELALSA
jgi:tetratricopeptide (TPR) repeat protein